MRINKLWFEDDKLFIFNEEGQTLYQSLLWYPRLMNASDAERMNYEVLTDGVHWADLDEDVSFESFYYPEKEPTGIALVFKLFPELNVSAIARKIGIKQSLLAAYISGAKKPSQEREDQIMSELRKLGARLSSL